MVGVPPESSASQQNPGGSDFYAALVAALGELSEVPKGREATAGTYSYSYADLGSVLTYVRPILAAHGLAVLQPVDSFEDSVVVETIIVHESGELHGYGRLGMPRGQTPQQTGSAITYARRYSLLSTLGLATADDDGAAASVAREYQPPKAEPVKQKRPGPGARAGAERIVALLQGEEHVTEDVAQEAVKAVMADSGRAWVDLIRFDIQDLVLADARNWLLARAAEESQEPPEQGTAAVTAPSTPNFYLKQAVVGARNVRAWIHRYTKLHPEDPVPGDLEMEGNRVAWVQGVLDDLDHQLEKAVESVDHHVPTAGSPNRRRSEREAEAQQWRDLHRLKALDKVALDLARWVSAARWSEGVKPGDLDRLESLVRQLALHTNHLTAQAQEQDLER